MRTTIAELDKEVRRRLSDIGADMQELRSNVVRAEGQLREADITLRGEPFCHTISYGHDYHAAVDVDWHEDQLGQPCLAFKGINKFLRKREVAP